MDRSIMPSHIEDRYIFSRRFGSGRFLTVAAGRNVYIADIYIIGVFSLHTAYNTFLRV